jgi:hypothetical protein
MFLKMVLKMTASLLSLKLINSRLQCINLSFNSIGLDGATALAESLLIQNSCLESLIVDGCIVVVCALMENKSCFAS